MKFPTHCDIFQPTFHWNFIQFCAIVFEESSKKKFRKIALYTMDQNGEILTKKFLFENGKYWLNSGGFLTYYNQNKKFSQTSEHILTLF